MSEGRKFTSWQGQDLTPEYDFTEPTSEVHVIWEEVEVGGRAWKGEADVGTVPIRDERGRTGNPANLPAGLGHISLAAHNRWRWTENNGSNTMARGWIGPKDYMRDLEGGLRADRYREVRMSVLDANEQLKGIIVDANRGAENDTTRVEWIRSTYLDGSPDPTRVIAGTYISSSNTVALPAQRVYGDPRSILAEIASFANKEVFVTSDEELFYDGWDSTAYASGIRISDRIAEQDIEGACTPASTPTVVDSLITDNNSGGAGFLEKSSIPVTEGQTVVAFVVSNTLTDWSSVRWHPDNDITSGDFYELTQAAAILTDHPNQVQMWVLLDAPAGEDAGTGALKYQYSDALDKIVHGWIVLDGAGSYTSATAKGTGTAAAVTTGADPTDLVIDLMGWFQNVGAPTNSTPGGSQAVLEQQTLNAPAGQSDGEGALSTATGLATASWTLATSVEWGHVSLAFSGAPGEVATFPPIWDVGPASTEDGQQLLSGLRLYYGAGSNTYVYVSSPTTVAEYGHYEESLYAPENITTAAAATTLANAVLARRRFEDRNINVSIGPMNETQVGCIKYGQLIDIKARAITYADDQFFTGRIRQLRWTTPVPGMFFAHMQIERPIKELPYGVGNRSGSEAVTNHVLQGSNAHPEFVLRATLTTQGDLPYRGASDWTRLAIGASNTHLISDGISPLWRPNPAASAGSTLTVEEDDGAPSVSATKIVFDNATVTDEGSGVARVTNSGGGLTQSYVGYNTIGASNDGTANRTYFIKITMATAGILSSIDAAIFGNSANVRGPAVGVYDDNSNAPGLVIAASIAGTSTTNGVHLNGTSRWVSTPIGIYLPAADYWLAFRFHGGGSGASLHYDATGTGYFHTTSGAWFSDVSLVAAGVVSSTTATWSIRGNVIR